MFAVLIKTGAKEEYLLAHDVCLHQDDITNRHKFKVEFVLQDTSIVYDGAEFLTTDFRGTTTFRVHRLTSGTGEAPSIIDLYIRVC